MTPQAFDVIVRVAGATLLILAAVMAGRHRDRRGALTFIALALCLCGFLAGNTPDTDLRLSGVAGRVGVLLSGYAAVFLWWYCLTVFDRRFRPRGLVLATGLAWILIASADRGLFGPVLAGRGLSWGLIGIGFAMIGHLGWRLARDFRGDLIDVRRRARVIVVGLLAAQLLADLGVDVVLGLDWQPRAFTIVQNMALLAFTGWLLQISATIHASAGPDTVPPSTAFGSALSPGAVNTGLAARLQRLIAVDRVHLDETLTFGRFVGMMGASERAVRDLINHQLGYDHFRTFLNAHRMVEARRLLSDPARRQDKLIAIALDSGFASLPSFNRVFRESEQCTPGAFRQAALAAADDKNPLVADF